MKTVGLTGGIGSGKTTVANFFMELGVPVYIADDKAKALMDTSSEVKEKINAIFGEQAYKHGILDRKFISNQVFADKKKLEELNSVVHPAVEKDFETWKKNQHAAYVIYEAAILFETGGYKKCDLTILVVADYQDKIKRLKKRDKTTISKIGARMAHQWTDEKKMAMADFIINNTKLSKTQEEAIKIHHIIS